MPVSVAPETPTESNLGAPPAGISYWWRVIGDWIKLLSPAGASNYEESMTVTANSGYTASDLSLTRFGKMVFIEGSVKPNSGTFGTTGAAVFTIPAAYKPRGFRRIASPNFASATASTLLASIDGGGVVTIQTNGAAGDTFYFLHAWRVA